MTVKCDCCEKRFEEIQCCSSGLGAISIAICKECLKNNAEPKYIINFILWETDGDIATWVKDITFYENGTYRKVGSLTKKEIDKIIEQENKIMKGFFCGEAKQKTKNIQVEKSTSSNKTTCGKEDL